MKTQPALFFIHQFPSITPIDWRLHVVTHHHLFVTLFHLSPHPHSLHLFSFPFPSCILTSWPPPPPPPIPPPLRPVMAPVSATPTPSPPPLWWATESCELHRETGEAASTLARWRASPDAPRSSRSVTSNCSCLTPFSLLHLILISLHSAPSDSPRLNRLLFFFNTLNSVGFVAEPGHRQKRWRR